MTLRAAPPPRSTPGRALPMPGVPMALYPLPICCLALPFSAVSSVPVTLPTCPGGPCQCQVCLWPCTLSQSAVLRCLSVLFPVCPRLCQHAPWESLANARSVRHAQVVASSLIEGQSIMHRNCTSCGLPDHVITVNLEPSSINPGYKARIGHHEALGERAQQTFQQSAAKSE